VHPQPVKIAGTCRAPTTRENRRHMPCTLAMPPGCPRCSECGGQGVDRCGVPTAYLHWAPSPHRRVLRWLCSSPLPCTGRSETPPWSSRSRRFGAPRDRARCVFSLRVSCVCLPTSPVCRVSAGPVLHPCVQGGAVLCWAAVCTVHAVVAHVLGACGPDRCGDCV
jgi:hypothetical protein